MKTRFVIVLTALMIVGSSCKNQYLIPYPHEGANGKYGFIDKTGKEVIPCKYNQAQDFSEGLAAVELNGKYGFIDKTGKEIIPFKYDFASSFSEGLACVKLNGKWGYINKTGKEVIPFKYDYANNFSEGFACVKLNGKYGYIDKTDKEVIPFKYDYVNNFSEGLAKVKLNGKCGYIDRAGEEVIPFKYDDIEKFSEGRAAILLNGKYGYVDTTGKEVVPLKYDGAETFSEGLAGVKLNGKWGFVDKDGNEVIPCQYDNVLRFSEGLAHVKLNGKWIYYIDKTGQFVDNNTTYKNEDYTVQYPADWSINEISAYPAKVFLSPYEDDSDSFAENFNVLVGNRLSSDDFDSYLFNLDIANKYLLINYKRHENNVVDTEWGKCLHVIYTGQENHTVSSTLRFEQYMWFLDNNKTILLTFTCRWFSCDNYKATFDNILKSFKIK